jgi:hypothetical protein
MSDGAYRTANAIPMVSYPFGQKLGGIHAYRFALRSPSSFTATGV